MSSFVRRAKCSPNKPIRTSASLHLQFWHDSLTDFRFASASGRRDLLLAANQMRLSLTLDLLLYDWFNKHSRRKNTSSFDSASFLLLGNLHKIHKYTKYHVTMAVLMSIQVNSVGYVLNKHEQLRKYWMCVSITDPCISY